MRYPRVRWHNHLLGKNLQKPLGVVFLLGLVCPIIGLISIGERAGQRVRRVLQDPEEGIRTGDLCYASRGFSLHAATQIAAENKDGLERLCSYVARPPLAAGSLQRISDEEYSFKLKTPWSNGTTHLIFSPAELIEKLAALVPPPRQNMAEILHCGMDDSPCSCSISDLSTSLSIRRSQSIW